jgi:hypothetical protein
LPPEVRSIIKFLKVKKLSGVDDITNKMIKRLRDRAVINAVLRLRHVPQRWKIADVIHFP